MDAAGTAACPKAGAADAATNVISKKFRIPIKLSSPS
jgi:hypothetical protein